MGLATTADIANVAATESAGTSTKTARADHVHALSGLAAWQAYTPAWTAVTTNPVLNNGVLEGWYTQIGKIVHFRIELTMGTTTTFGSGSYNLSLPVTSVAVFTGAGSVIGWASLFDVSAPASKRWFAFHNTNTQIRMQDADGANVSNTNPWTWASGDKISVQGCYEAA